LDQLEDRAPGRAVRLPVDRRPFDVVEAAEREEVVALVVIERLFVAQPFPDRVRVGVDLEVVRVVVDGGVRHRYPPTPAETPFSFLEIDAIVARNGGEMPHFTKPDEGSWTEHYPELGTAPVSYADSISPEIYERERDAIFGRTWLNIGRVEQLPRKGS